MSAAWCHRLQEGAEFGAGPPVVEEQASSPHWPLGRPEPVGKVIPEKITQPPLGDLCEIEVVAGAVETNPEVLGLDVAGLLGLLRGEVDDPQFGGNLAQETGEAAGNGPASRRQIEQRPNTVVLEEADGGAELA
ncbi:hypothetical protein ACWCXX_36025 [Streptomyces sp. NPDC001732]